MTKKHEAALFEDMLDDNDFGLIICGNTGKLKGLWIPIHKEEEPVPQSIIDLCVEVFGIDPKEFNDDESSDGHILH